MKKAYETPELELTKFSFSAVLANGYQDSLETPASGGGVNQDDDDLFNAGNDPGN